MPTVTYHPDDTGGSGWKGTTVNEERDDYSGAELTTVSTDDTNSVGYSYGGEQATHKWKIPIDEAEGNVTQIDVSARVVNGTGAQHKLYIYNFDTSSWELLDTDNNPIPPYKVTLSGSVSSSLGDYIDGSGNVEWKVEDQTAGPNEKVEYTYITVESNDPPDMTGQGVMLV